MTAVPEPVWHTCATCGARWAGVHECGNAPRSNSNPARVTVGAVSSFPEHRTVPLDLLRRLLWAAKGAPCSCLWSGGTNMPTTQNYECPRCRAVRELQEAVPDVIG